MFVNIPLFKIYWGEEDIKSVGKVIRSGKYWATGPQIEEFEQKIADYLGIKHCLAFNSGGSALFTLMHSYGFKKGDEIIVPSFTFIATAYAPLCVGAKPVFADIEEKTLGLDPEDVERKITPHTKAIMPIHYGGMPCQIKKLRKIARNHNLILIEDAAESFGAKLKDKYVGTFGDSAILSFCQNKIFTTGEGGAIITNNDKIYEKAKLFRSYGRKVKGNYFEGAKNLDYITLGHNFRLSSILATLGISQLKKVDYIIKKRRKIAKHLNKKLKKIDKIVVFQEPNEDYFAVYQMYAIRVLQGEKIRDNLMQYLKDKGISTKTYFDPVHEYTIFKKLGYKNISLPKTRKLSSQVLNLPIYPGITDQELDYIIDTIKEFFSKK
ncbi:aminotransferase DegT [Candidatus Parcubacteria bacterium 4484_255]|nr:MAG: aminotransferase DegT [Candidatus Parcubacteria bacterium 4484_255]